MTETPHEPHLLQIRLADQLAASGSLRSDAWRDALLATPRHTFVRRFYRYDPETDTPRLVTSGDPQWLDAVYSDEPLVTQFNNDRTATTGIPTSSSTAPDLMLHMLEALEVQRGDNVLEIGTGTGYNAALLCHRLGDSQVTTIDVDESLTSAASDRLAELGLHPTVVTADGANGHPDNAPYDRIIATCAVRRVPAAWLQQTRPGGSILVTLETSLHGYGLAHLTIDEHHHGRGRILGQPASFMPMRSHADPAYATLKASAAPQVGAPRRSRITTADLDSDDARFILGLALPDVAAFATGTAHDGLFLAHHTDRSWAELRADGTVVRGGARDLWSVLEQAHEAWATAGRPPRHKLAIAATNAEQTLRFDADAVGDEVKRPIVHADRLHS